MDRREVRAPRYRRDVRIARDLGHGAGHWLDDARDMATRPRDALRARPVWLLSSGPVGEPTGKLAKLMGQDPVRDPSGP